MNNKGFTLIELLATIALLAVISVISFVSINAVTKDSKVKNCESLLINLTSVTKEYVSDNRYIQGANLDNITAFDLIERNYLNKDLIDPFTNEIIDATKIKIEIEKNSDYSVKSVKIKINGNEIDCSNELAFQNAI